MAFWVALGILLVTESLVQPRPTESLPVSIAHHFCEARLPPASTPHLSPDTPPLAVTVSSWHMS